jgi:hypothetical protein
MFYKKNLFYLCLSLLSFSSLAVLKDSPKTTIRMIKAGETGSSYHTLYVNYDVKDSPCKVTNTFNRYTIKSKEQLSVALTALSAGLEVVISTNDKSESTNDKSECKDDIQEIGYIKIYAR